MATVELQIDKMHCGACVRRVAQTLNSLPETRAESVAVGSARVSSPAPEEALRALDAAGFPARVVATQP